MVFNHLTYNITNNDVDVTRESYNTIILLDDEGADENARVVAQAISLDIRGDFGSFLNTMDMVYEWTGNLFHIVMDRRENTVEIINITDAESIIYEIEYAEWIEALEDWKRFYLSELGFLEFESIALSHMLGVLILTYDQISDGYCTYEMFTEAIKKCASRYGISKSVIYRDCKKVTGVYEIERFYDWAVCILENIEIKEEYLSEYIVKNTYHYGDIRPALRKYFNYNL